MNIVYINHYAGSDRLGMEFRPYYLAQQWQQQGHRVLILAGDYSHLRKHNPPVKHTYQIKDIDGVDFMFIKSGRYSGNGLDRIKSMLRFVYHTRRATDPIQAYFQPDVIICSSTYPFDTYAGQHLAKKTGARLYHEIHDLWPLTPMELGGYSKYHPFIMTMQQAEDSVYKNSAKIISILPNAKEYVRSRGIDTPVIHIPNGLPEAYFSDPAPANPRVVEAIHQLRQQYDHVIAYAGGLSISNAMDFFVQAFEAIDSDHIAGLIIGDGIERTKLQQMVQAKQLPITFLDPIPKESIIASLKLADSLYLGSTKNKLYRYGFGMNKMFDYMMAGLPIVMAIDGQHSPLHELGLAISARPEDPADIARAIESVETLSAEERQAIREQSPAFVKKHHHYANLSQRFIDAMTP